MNPAEKILFLRQGINNIEDFTGQFCALFNYLKWKDSVFYGLLLLWLEQTLKIMHA